MCIAVCVAACVPCPDKTIAVAAKFGPRGFLCCACAIAWGAPTVLAIWCVLNVSWLRVSEREKEKREKERKREREREKETYREREREKDR